MPHLPPTGSVERLDLASVLRRLERAHGPDCARWAAPLHLAAGRARGTQAQALRVLARACDPLLRPGEPGGPYLPRRTAAGARTAGPADLSDQEIALLEATVSPSAPACWRARVADLAWLTGGSRARAEEAVAALAEVVGQEEALSPPALWPASEALLRCAQIVRELQRGARAYELFARALTALLPSARSLAHPLPLHRLLQAALHVDLDGLDGLVDLVIGRAEREVARCAFPWGRVFYGHAERLLEQAGCARDAETLWIVRASVLADEARFRLAAGDPPWIPAAYLGRAMGELRAVEGTAQLVEGLQGELAALRAAGAGDGRVDVSEATEAALLALDQEPDGEALDLLAMLPLEEAGGSRDVLERSLRWDPARRAWSARGPRRGGARRRAPWATAARTWGRSVVEDLRRALAARPQSIEAGLRVLCAGNPRARAAQGLELLAGVRAALTGDPREGLERLRRHGPELAAVAPADGLRQLLEGGTPGREAGGPRAEANVALWAALRLLVEAAPRRRLEPWRMVLQRPASA